jgi:hypothetical protein
MSWKMTIFDKDEKLRHFDANDLENKYVRAYLMNTLKLYDNDLNSLFNITFKQNKKTKDVIVTILCKKEHDPKTITDMTNMECYVPETEETIVFKLIKYDRNISNYNVHVMKIDEVIKEKNNLFNLINKTAETIRLNTTIKDVDTLDRMALTVTELNRMMSDINAVINDVTLKNPDLIGMSLFLYETARMFSVNLSQNEICCLLNPYKIKKFA